MTDAQCVEFLQWALPRLHMRWSGFRKVRSQVCKRLASRLQVLGLVDTGAYRNYLSNHAEEWRVLDSLCRVTISRFYREKAVFQFIEQQVLPVLIQQANDSDVKKIRILCLGSASGEEPYTLAILWRLQFQARYPDIALDITATDSDPVLIERAQQALYPYSSIKNLPQTWRQAAFDRANEMFRLRPEYHQPVKFVQQDIRQRVPDELFDMVLCRNLVFTYFDDSLQLRILDRISHVLRAEGILVLGIHETLPELQTTFSTWSEKLRVFIKNLETSG